MTESASKILVVAYHFPPDRAVGALRAQKFVKYLPELGWQPHVLTIKEQYVERSDPSRMADVAGARVVRTEYFRTPLQYFFHLRDRLMKKNSVVAGGVIDKDEAFVEKPRKGLMGRLILLLHWLNCLPDERMYWIPPALLEGYRTIKKHGIGCIYATSPPHSADMIGAILAMATGAKFVVDMRDPWASGYARYEISPALIVDAFLERFVLRRANAIITTTEEHAALISAVNPAYGSKTTTIYNGFDLDDFAGLTRRRRDDTFVCTYLGNFYLQRSPLSLLTAVKDLLTARPDLAEKIRIRFVGTQRHLNGVDLEALCGRMGLQRNVSLESAVSYRESLQTMMDSDVLLLFAPNQPMQIPAKLFEYLASRRPILAFTEAGATATVVTRNDAGIIVPQDDLASIKDALLTLYERRQNGHEFYRGADVGKFDRRRQAGQLAELLASVTA